MRPVTPLTPDQWRGVVDTVSRRAREEGGATDCAICMASVR
jgi:hypothetical protein